MKKTNRRPPKGAVVAEAFALKGAKVAEKLARRLGAHELAEKIRRGAFRPPRGPFNAARAQARAAAIRLIARYHLA